MSEAPDLTPKGMTPEALEQLLSTEIEQGINFINGSEFVAEERDKNLDYYYGRMKDLPVNKGRSSVVDKTLADGINDMLPGLLRVFTAGKNIAEYNAARGGDANLLKLVTRFVNDVVFRKDNRGEIILYQWAFDALVQKVGILKATWLEKYDNKDQTLEGMDENQLALTLIQSQLAGLEVAAHTPRPDGLHDLTLRRKVNVSHVAIYNVPPDEFIISRDARSLEDATLVAHRSFKLVGDLLKEGYPQDLIDTLEDWKNVPTTGTAPLNRANNTNATQRNIVADPALRQVAIYDGIVRCDYEGDGVRDYFFVAGAARSKVTVLKCVPYDNQIVFADFCPNPVPHTFWGRCPADDLAGLQKENTVIKRGMYDNLYLAITPQREVVQDWIIKPDQLMNMAPGAPVLVKQPGAIREIAIPFVADKVLTVMQDNRAAAERRIGSMAGMGLDPDVLTNQSATSAQLAYDKSTGRTELIARIWADGGMRKLFRGILNILRTYQDFERIVRIDGQEVPIDPRAWAGLEDVDVNINTGLGTGNRSRDFAILGQVIAAMKESIGSVGPNQAINFNTLNTTFKLWLESAGVDNPDTLCGDLPPNWAPQPPAPPQPSPDTVVNAESFKQVEAAKLQQKTTEALAKIQSDERVALAEIESKERIATGENLVKRDANAINAARAALEHEAKQNESSRSDD